MAKLTIMFGVVLILVGLLGYVATGHHAPTALIPAYVGIVLAALGALANTEDAKKRMLFMHIAVTIGLLGFLGTAKSIVDYIEMVNGRQFPHPIAVEEKAAMAGVLLVFVVLCVRSFIAARRARA
jgi:amino acid permease